MLISTQMDQDQDQDQDPFMGVIIIAMCQTLTMAITECEWQCRVPQNSHQSGQIATAIAITKPTTKAILITMVTIMAMAAIVNHYILI